MFKHKIRNSDLMIKALSEIRNFDNFIITSDNMQGFIASIMKLGDANPEIAEDINEIIFKLCCLKEFEKQHVRDFFNVQHRTGKNALASRDDLQRYADRFRHVFGFVLKEDSYLNAKCCFNSPSDSVAIIFIVVDIKDKKPVVEILESFSIKEFIAANKIKLPNNKAKFNKNKLYGTDSIVIIKSNQFKDWTETSAIKDANREIGEFLGYLKERELSINL